MTPARIDAVEQRWLIGAQTLGVSVVVAMLLGAGFGTAVITISGAFPLILIAAPLGATTGSLFGVAVGLPLAAFVSLATHRLSGRGIAIGMHVVTLMATFALAATYIRHFPISTRSVVGVGLFFVVFGQLGVVFVARWYRNRWSERGPASASIGTTACGAWANYLVYGSAFGAVGAAIVGAAVSQQQPQLFIVYAAFAAFTGATFGFVVGNVVGIPFAVLVIVADKHHQQASLARAMPWLAVALSAPLAILLGLASIVATVSFVALDAAFAFVGGRSIARRYLRAEGPKIRQLVH